MQRLTHELADTCFDVLIIGGGAFGAAAARDASLRGLRTALIERGDFGGGTSANCFRMVHGGIRYLQHGDVRRLRYSCRERAAWLRTAPHLVRPLPILVPTYGRGRQGRLFLRTGMTVYDLLTLGRNAGIDDEARHIANCRSLSRDEVLRTFPEIDTPRLTGAAVFEDGQMHNPARLVLAMITSAADAGAVVCNYMEALRLVRSGNTVTGVIVHDLLEDVSYEVRSRLVLNAAGPWAEQFLQDKSGEHRFAYSRDACVTLKRAPSSEYALALPGRSRDSDAILSRPTRHLFLAPWGDFTLLGVWHQRFEAHPDMARVEEHEILAWLDEVNAACPALDLKADDVGFVNCGLLPFGNIASGDEFSFGKQSHIVDHRSSHGIEGIVTIIGNRFTTARGDSEQALNVLLRQLPGAPAAAPTDRLPLTGGDIADFPALRERFVQQWSPWLPRGVIEPLVSNHGSNTATVMNFHAIGDDVSSSATVPDSNTLWAEVTHAVLNEAAVRLEDVILRRTELGAGRHPGRDTLEHVARHMAKLLHWSSQRMRREVEDCDRRLRWHIGHDALNMETVGGRPTASVRRNPREFTAELR